MVAVVVSAVLIGAGVAAAIRAHPTDKGGVYYVARAPQPSKPVTVPSTLTGLPVDPAVNQRPVLGVMIENSLEARPQSGLDQAGVVFEAIAEGGITRFLALYQDTQPGYIGPVRSVRPYYAQWCMSFDCALAHAGGSPEALQNIRAWRTKDLDQFANGPSYQRITERYAPHNLYTSAAALHELAASKGYASPTYTAQPRKKDAAVAGPQAVSIDFDVSGVRYNPHFDYQAATNTYTRSQAGAVHMSINRGGSQTPIQPKVVVALVVPYGIAADQHSQYGTLGSGPAMVFQDGLATPAQWHKTDTAAPFQLTDAAGAPLPLNAGQTWYTALASQQAIHYK